MGTTFLLSLVGAFISDAYLTRSKTLLISGFVEFLSQSISLSNPRRRSLIQPQLFRTHSHYYRGKPHQVQQHIFRLKYSCKRSRPISPLERVGWKILWIRCSSASAQVIADVALCPFEAIKVRVQTEPKFGKGLVDGFSKLYATEGLSGLYRGLFPLWGRNLPFSVLMFSTFEHSVEFLYHDIIQKSKEDCSRAQQLGVTCIAGYASGAVGTVVSNPADNIVASLYNKKANNVLQAVKSIGLVNLFTRSLPIRIALVGPVVTLQWLFYDSIKVLTGLPTSGGVNSYLDKANVTCE